MALGLLVAGVLLLRSLALLETEAAGGPDLCSALFRSGCDEALAGPQARLLGVPLAGWGLAHFGVLAALLVLAWTLGPSFEGPAHRGALVLGLLAATVGVVLVVRGSFASQAPCPLCLVVHGTSLALLLPLARLQHASWRAVVFDWGAALRYAVGGRVADETQARWRVVGFLAAALVGLVLLQWALVETRVREATAQGGATVQDVVAAYERATPREIPLRPDDPRLGRADAPLTLVAFSSFECPGCRTFAVAMRRLAERFPDDLAIVFKHFPLGARCNALVQRDLQPNACAAACAAEAARRQGAFWPLHDRLFEARLRDGDAALAACARAAGLDLEAFERDRLGPDAEARVIEDAALGERLGVTSTPALFLQGRRLQGVAEGSLVTLLEHLLRRARR